MPVFSQNLNKHRRDAEARVAAAIDARATALVGMVPQIEKDSWPSKEIAARMIKDPDASNPPQDERLIAIEAQTRGKGESLEALADKIIANANTYRDLVAVFSGLRIVAAESINAATDLPQIEQAEAIALAKVNAVGAQ